jgi:regulator of RNase E activity RraB
LAEALSTPVYELKERMPVSEYFGWTSYYKQKNEEEERANQKQKGNLLAMDEDEMIRGLTG